ncbi:MAG: alpha/beta hydrolase [Halioglobus sp.]
MAKLRDTLATLLIFLSLTVCCVATHANDDHSLRGAYTVPDGDVVVISPFDGKLRFFMQNGRTGSLVKVKDGTYVGNEPGQTDTETAHTLLTAETGMILNWEGDDHSLTQVPIKETDYPFPSGKLNIAGRLVAPANGNYVGLVILVHGSERYSALDNSYLPYLLAANGLATFVFDKRGTGSSDGAYTQDFSLLADDVVAAINFVDTIPQVDSLPIMLAGFSQGGWVAPLAAAQSTEVDAILVGYGPAVSLFEEDRWGYVYWLEKEGYTADDIAKADQLHAMFTDMRTRGRPDRWGEIKPLIDKYQGEQWYREGIKNTDSSLPALTHNPVPLTVMYWWTSLFGLELFVDYDPIPVLQKLDIPSYWLFAGEDASQPTDASVVNLEKLASAGKPIGYKIYPDTGHGIAVFEQGEGRERAFLAYHPDYYSDMINWLRDQAVNQQKVSDVTAKLKQ